MMTRNTPTDWRACPFCGKRDLFLSISTPEDLGEVAFVVKCDNDDCQAEGPAHWASCGLDRYVSESRIAVDLWNGRTAIQ